MRSARSAIDPQYVAAAMPTPTSAVTAEASSVGNGTPGSPIPTTMLAAEPRRQRRRWRLIAMLGAATALALGTWWLTVGTHSTVPDLLGIPVADAQQALHSVSLDSTVEPAWDNAVPEGSVIDAQPLPGTSVVHGTKILLIVSKGPERYQVPVLQGLTVGEAKAALAAVKLKMGRLTAKYDEQVATGVILSTYPEVGAIAQPGDSVDIVTSKGPAPIPVPSVNGLTLDAADATLRTAGFSTSSATAFDDQVITGAVIRTEPRSGTALPRGSHVKIVVSKGPAPVRVPDVFKMSQSKAEATLKAAGLNVKVIKSSGRLLNLVKTQSPGVGTTVPRGTLVTITIV